MTNIIALKKTQKHTQKENKAKPTGPSSPVTTAHECAYDSVQLWYTVEHLCSNLSSHPPDSHSFIRALSAATR